MEIKDLENFSHGIRCILLLQRKKEGETTNSKCRCIERMISNSKEEFFPLLEKMRKIKEREEKENGTTLRIYSSVNERDLKKAVLDFKTEQLKTDYQGEETVEWFYKDVKNRFLHSLMKESSKKTASFLFDIDDCCDRSFCQMLSELERNTVVMSWYKTKNGYHVITTPFNHTKLDERFKDTLHTDGLILIE